MKARDKEQLGFALDQPASPVPPERPTLPDRAARTLIATGLDTNLLVEAGAGSGKTRELVTRMVALVQTGRAQVREIAAVTFTRKAASELRQRFQEALEKERARGDMPHGELELISRALEDIDQAFMGTIHAFCARLLRERPIEAGIDPAFAETTAAEALADARRFWSIHIERLVADGDPILGELESIGLKPAELRDLYEELREFPDVEFPTEAVQAPDPADVSACRIALEQLLRDAEGMIPRVEPEDGWDQMQLRVRTLLYRMRHSHGRWKDDRFLLDTLGTVSTEWELVQKRWADDTKGKAAAKGLCERFNAFFAIGGAAERVLDQWWAYRYPTAMRFAKDAAAALTAERRATGRLDFQDLLSLAARLLRQSPRARAALGRRWQRILVDEFQDTDPLQAEVLFLLASDPQAAEDWVNAEPRPGALFVVGDPKQSIYRFRRADIALYARVRARFESFGAVVRLTSNFRSGPPIAAIVNDVFAPPHGFPERGDEIQAGFASLDPQPRAEPAPREGVFHFTAQLEGHIDRNTVGPWESQAIADWVARRIANGERKPGDFLILTKRKEPLLGLARACEARGLAVQVSGTGVRAEHELSELILLLSALSDPSDASLTVGVLIGLFFGVDHEQLLAHREAGRGFDLRRAERTPGPDSGPVEAALARMRSWWEVARGNPADAVVAMIADDLGLLPHAAAGDLGSLRAGALAYALDAVRASGLEGDTSLAGALEALAAALAEEEAEAPLEPGRGDVVRLMNLHKAKGLEAPIVVLAAPYGRMTHPIKRTIERGVDGSARGWIVVEDRDRSDKRRTIARPRGWGEKESRERSFRDAEELRLLYVAVTRAGQELIVSRVPRKAENSPWKPLENWLESHGTPISLAPSAPPERLPLDRTSAELDAATNLAERARAAAGAAGYSFRTVTQLVKGDVSPDGPRGPGRPQAGSSGPGGYEWGSAVHAVLEAATRGAAGGRLTAIARGILVELDRPMEGGEPTELTALMDTVAAVKKSALWRRAEAATRRLAEVPFALDIGNSVWLEGVVDLAFHEPDGWVIVDYKTDQGRDSDFAMRRQTYREQLRRYGEAWTRLTGDPVKERAILWTRRGEEERVDP